MTLADHLQATGALQRPPRVHARARSFRALEVPLECAAGVVAVALLYQIVRAWGWL